MGVAAAGQGSRCGSMDLPPSTVSGARCLELLIRPTILSISFSHCVTAAPRLLLAALRRLFDGLLAVLRRAFCASSLPCPAKHGRRRPCTRSRHDWLRCRVMCSASDSSITKIATHPTSAATLLLRSYKEGGGRVDSRE